MECGNWRGITLLPVAAKVLGKVIITRIRDSVDTRLRQEHMNVVPRSPENTKI